ncbi:hypothetical protein BDR03DRAFT_976421 [Suillus americanus]|nr:hypothetical protein BDR03DRAFT_976421 [Suillus americanus]
MSSHLPTFHQPRSGPVVFGNGSSICNVITSSNQYLRLSPMSAEGVQAERYDKRKPM